MVKINMTRKEKRLQCTSEKIFWKVCSQGETFDEFDQTCCNQDDF